MSCPRTHHPNNVPRLRGEKHDISLKILHQAGFETAWQAATSAERRHALTITPFPSRVNCCGDSYGRQVDVCDESYGRHVDCSGDSYDRQEDFSDDSYGRQADCSGDSCGRQVNRSGDSYGRHVDFSGD